MISPFAEKNLFTLMDHAIVRSAVKQLPGLLSMIVEMRFWKRLSLEDIADDLGVSVGTVETAIIKAIVRLREECMRNPAFSRSQYQALESMRATEVA